MRGFRDPTQDVALLHFLFYGKHLPNIRREQARRVNALAPHYRLDVIDRELVLKRIIGP